MEEISDVDLEKEEDENKSFDENNFEDEEEEMEFDPNYKEEEEEKNVEEKVKFLKFGELTNFVFSTTTFSALFDVTRISKSGLL